MINYSKEMFNFKELEVEKICTKWGIEYVYVKCKLYSQECTYCGKLTYKSKGYGKERHIRDIQIYGLAGILLYRPKR